MSLDTITRESFKTFKGKDLLHLVMANLENAIKRVCEHAEVELVIKRTATKGVHELGECEAERVVEYFRPVAASSDRTHVEIRKEFSWGVAHSNRKAYCRSFCDLSFYQLAVSWDGVVSCCCNDITYDLAIGRIGPGGDTLHDILDGQRRNAVLKAFLGRESKSFPQA